MAKRLFLIALLATAFAACKSSKSSGSDKESSMSDDGSRTTAAMVGRDDIETALMRLGIEGRVLRIDLNETEWKSGPVKVAQAHLLSNLLLLESGGDKPRVIALNRAGLQPRWISELAEPTAFPAAETPDAVLLTSAHHVSALEAATGRRSMRFMGGALDGTRRPTLKLPFTPTGSAVGQIDTLYLPTLGSADNNKNLESFSLVNGMRGWGYSASGMIRTAPAVAGDVGDPKLYFVTGSGLLTCIDAKNYGQRPAGPRWEALLEAGVEHGFFVTRDTSTSSIARAWSIASTASPASVAGSVRPARRRSPDRRFSATSACCAWQADCWRSTGTTWSTGSRSCTVPTRARPP